MRTSGPRIYLKLSLRHSYKCFVCKQEIHPTPQGPIPNEAIVANEELHRGVMPQVCISCGKAFDFKRSRKALKSYIRFLEMHTPTGRSK